MPIGINTGAAPSTTPVTGAASGIRERWFWVTPFGVERELTNFANGTEVGWASGGKSSGYGTITGRYAPLVKVTNDVVPFQAGARTRQVRHDVRELDMALYVVGDSFPDLQARLRQLTVDMDPVRGVGTLRRVARDGTESNLYCRCIGGLGVETEGRNGPFGHQLNLIFQAVDPYWYGRTISRSFSGLVPSGWFNMLPVHLGSGSVLGAVSVDSESDVETWPMWTIVGPGDDPTLINNTTGLSTVLNLPSVLTTGQKIVIDTQPGAKTVLFYSSATATPTNYRRYLTGRALWPLEPGVNDITLAMSATTTASYMAVSWQKRTLTP